MLLPAEQSLNIKREIVTKIASAGRSNFTTVTSNLPLSKANDPSLGSSQFENSANLRDPFKIHIVNRRTRGPLYLRVEF